MSELTDFLKSKKEKRMENNYLEIRADWLTSLDSFYKQVMQWIEEPLAEALLSIRFMQNGITINEELIGQYDAPSLYIETDWSSVSLIPVARFIVGAQGRIDMKSSQALSAILLRLEKGESEAWYYLNKDNMERIKIDEKVFQTLLKDML